jgi:hypothetical protein
MHIREGAVADCWPSLLGKTYINSSDEELQITSNDSMWNAGLIGLHEDDEPLVEEFKLVHDSLMRQRMPLSEQFAVGHVLEANTYLQTAEDVVYHYWGSDFRKRFAPILDVVLRESQKMPLQKRHAYLYEHRPRLTRVQLVRRMIKRPLVRLGILPVPQRASHDCFAPGMPRGTRGR